MLREAAKSEFSLRGPFPTKAYERIMLSTGRILDGLYAMRLVAERRSVLTEGERALLASTAVERDRLCSRVCNMFQTVASSLMLEFPLTDAAPGVGGLKDRLLSRIHRLRGDGATEHDLALLYAYTLVTMQVAQELGSVRDEIQGLFGILRDDALLLQ